MIPSPNPGEPGERLKLTVFGATGGVGGEVVTPALDRGGHVTAYVRNPAKLGLAHPNLAMITGGLANREAVQRAVRGADAEISALGPSLDLEATGMPLVARTRTIVEAMRAEGVERYIDIVTRGLLGFIAPSWAARSGRAPTGSCLPRPNWSPTAPPR